MPISLNKARGFFADAESARSRHHNVHISSRDVVAARPAKRRAVHLCKLQTGIDLADLPLKWPLQRLTIKLSSLWANYQLGAQGAATGSCPIKSGPLPQCPEFQLALQMPAAGRSCSCLKAYSKLTLEPARACNGTGGLRLGNLRNSFRSGSGTKFICLPPRRWRAQRAHFDA